MNDNTTVGGFSVHIIKGRTLGDRVRENNIVGKLLAVPVVLALTIGSIGLFQNYAVPVVNSFKPIINDVSYHTILVTPKRVILELSGAKGLAAEFIDHSETGEAWVKNKWVQVNFKFLDDEKENDDTKGTSRPRSNEPQAFGEWEWSGNMGEVTQVRARVQHLTDTKVQFLWIDGVKTKSMTGKLRSTIFGPFDVEPYGSKLTEAP